jgi:Tfp pilus assembly protein PilF
VSYLVTQSFIWLHYTKLFFLPVGLTADTDWGLISKWYDTQVVAGMVFLAVLGYVVWKSSKTERWRPVAFGTAWFALALLPTSSVFPLAEVANEHRVFFPFIGLSLAVVWAIGVRAQRWFDERPHLRQLAAPAAFMAAALVITGHAIGTHERNKVWASEESLWRDVVEKSPRNGRALMNYGLTQMSQGKFAEARQLFERAKILNPNYATLEINLGIVTGSMGAQALAEQHFLRALQLQSSDPNTHYYYARWLVNQGRAREAIPRLQEAIKLSPATVDARALLMNVYYAAGADAELQALAKETRAISPDDPTASAYAGGASPLRIEPPTAQAYYARGLGFTQQGDHLNAAQAYREALKLDPKDPNFQNNFGWSRAKLGFLDESVPAFEEALRLKPDFALAKNNLAWVRAQLAARK